MKPCRSIQNESSGYNAKVVEDVFGQIEKAPMEAGTGVETDRIEANFIAGLFAYKPTQDAAFKQKTYDL